MRASRTPTALVCGLMALTVARAALAQSGARQAGGGQDDEGQETAAESDDALPAGHPALGGANPHGRGAGGGMPGVFHPPEDTEQADATMPPGSIAVDLRDADDRPVAGEVVTLGVLMNSIAKGDSRKHVQMPTDGEGRSLFTGLDTASSTAYRVSVGYQGGLFAAAPFQLQQAKAMRVVLHVYPVTRDIRQALIVCEATLAVELRDDRVQVEQALTFYNLGRMAWQPDDVRIPLPDGFTAFDSQTTMSDQGVDQGGGGAKLRGTFAPGQHAIQFRFQVPWTGERDVDFDIGLPPHVAIARVMMPATAQIKLGATGFPAAEVRHDAQGQGFLVTERRLRPEDAPLTILSIGLHDLPSPGPGRLIATLLAACGVGVGIVFSALRGQRPRAASGGVKAARNALLEELAELERARAAGDVGPRSYERARRELVDAMARTLMKN
jgi:hypothetical protein